MRSVANEAVVLLAGAMCVGVWISGCDVRDGRERVSE